MIDRIMQKHSWNGEKCGVTPTVGTWLSTTAAVFDVFMARAPSQVLDQELTSVGMVEATSR